MDFKALKTFVSIADTGSFSHTAEQLHISQPAVSKRIATLESQIGHKLLDRVGRQVLLTEAGKSLLMHAQRVLASLDDAARELSHLHEHVSGRLSIGTSHHVGLHRLPPVLRQFTHTYPEVDLDIHFMDSEQACDAVLAGSLEMAVVTLPPDADSRLNTELLWHDPLDVIVSHTHPLALQQNKHPPVVLTDLAQHPAVLPDAQTYTHRIISSALAEANTQLHVRLATNYLETIKMLVSIGLGWGVLPRSMVDREIVALHIPGLNMQRDLGIVRHQDRATSAAAYAFAKTASECSATGGSDKPSQAIKVPKPAAPAAQ